jgi:tetratricopeptide (TPR) repeat protein
MKRVFFTILAGLLVLFIITLAFKFESSNVENEQGDDEKKIVEKEKIQRFWKIYRQAREHRIAGRLKEAAEDYQTALVLNDQHEDALYYLGNVSLELGRFKDAEKAWKRLVEVNPNSARAHFQLGDLYLCLEREEFFNVASAEAEFRQALEINREETGALLRLGQIALIRGNLSEAGRYFDAVTASNYQSVEAHFLKGYIAWKKGNWQKALALLGKAVKYSRPSKPVKGVLGEGDTKSGRPLSLSERTHCRPLFYTHVKDLSGLDESSLSQQMEGRYQKVDAFLEQVRSKVQS